MSYRKNISFEFITKIIKIFLAFFTSVIIARSLGPKDLGYVKFLLLTLTTLAQFGHIGIIDATSYFQRKSKYDLEKIFKVNFTFLCILSTLITGTLIVLKYLDIIFENYSFTIITLTAFSIIFFTFFNNLLGATLISKEKIIELNKTLLYPNFVSIFLYFILWLTGTLNIITYLTVFSFTTILRNVLLIRKTDIKFRFSFDLKIIFEEVSYGIIIYFGAFFIFLNYRMDQWLIKLYLDNTQLGLYSIGVVIAEMVLLVPTSVINPLRAKLYNINTDSSEYKKLTAKTIKFSIYITLLIALPLYFGANIISSEFLYGVRFQESVEVIKILLLGILFLTFGKVGSHYFVIKGKPLIHLVTAFLVLSLNAILNMYLIPKIGINGAAWASTISYTLYGLMYIFIYIFREKFKFSELFILSRSEIIAITDKLKLILKR
ncbi:MAG: oligosaccharide flippase family protein [Candidatus Delongbacteria bacterium]|nr:oligosaccharide flippase family protein [Candidatus Delongbacteria bacterium]